MIGGIGGVGGADGELVFGDVAEPDPVPLPLDEFEPVLSAWPELDEEELDDDEAEEDEPPDAPGPA